MDALTEALYDVLSDDNTLDTLASAVRYFRRPESPQSLIKPVVVFNLSPGTDARGLHGAAMDIAYEIDIWGYYHDGNNMAPDCVRIAQRIHEILVTHKLTLPRGGHVRWGADMTFGNVDQQDPDVILLRGIYGTRYWSGSSIDEIILESS